MMMSIFQKNKSGYVLLSAIIFLAILSGLVFQIEQHQQANIASQAKVVEMNDARVLCNILILRRKDDSKHKGLKSDIGDVEVLNKKFIVTLKNQHCYKFTASDQPL
ncbi:hypothetical protein [Pediococcus parvulus]|uniref:hypothetical protein n=2 Tax=Pediococcus parvulus TaxID=54062 RepID=UPI00116CC789|nr:hypothetical protein [Pediococcus parvulus]GEL90370.1 hypothetical protein PPA04_16010 [Pediococcus parvulus]GHC14577.1 hypothetical protein GCM10008912_17730 [Pediococcus parvulus]